MMLRLPTSNNEWLPKGIQQSLYAGQDGGPRLAVVVKQ